MRKDYQYKVTLVVPIYNMEAYLEKCLDSVAAQTIDKSQLEVLLLNDGSTDDSAKIIEKYAKEYTYFKPIHKENEGLSKTRNRGIREARGKYIMYLDSDDTITPETIRNVTDFFDLHYDEIDLVSYYEEVTKRNGTVKPHHRHSVLNKTGIYDLTLLENAFCSQTNINICVKNEFEESVLFDTSGEFRQEDQKYCTDILLKKMKLGYCAEAAYRYLKNNNSITGTWFYSYYLFEPSMRYWEDLFAYFENDRIPYYIQALYLNDINWKNNADILLPYHYNPDDLETAKKRIGRLLDLVSDEVIVNHPGIDAYHKAYYITKKSSSNVTVHLYDNRIEAFDNGYSVCRAESIQVFISKICVEGENIRIMGRIRSPIFGYTERPRLYANINKGEKPIELELLNSSFGYHKSKNEITKAWNFELSSVVKDSAEIAFAVGLEDHYYETALEFGETSQLRKGRKQIIREMLSIEHDEKRIIINRITKRARAEHIKKLLLKYARSNTNLWLIRNRAWRIKNKKNVWLYYDCKGVLHDNGYYQFEHDMQIKDGVERYYVLNEENFKNEVRKYPSEYRNRIIQFGGTKHIELFLACSKVITAYIETNNVMPFRNMKDYSKNLDLFDYPKVYYLQHGVLHAHLPWKYSYDRLGIEKEIISTRFEEKNLKENYGFRDKNLAKAGMPRYDYIDSSKEASLPRRILYAPSWRRYLIGSTGSGWVSKEDLFVKSDFFKETQAFLNNKQLHEMLNKNDLRLDFKAHPIFERYNHLYEIQNERIGIADKKVNESDYAIFITDFSSFVYDFAYLNRPIIYFVPDYIQFKSGMNLYRQLDMPIEDGLGELTKNEKEIVAAIERVINNDYRPLAKYKEREKDLFFYYDNNQRDRVYNALKES